MATSRTVLAALLTAGALISFAISQTPEPEGRVTSIFHDVQVLPTQADARAAAINDKVEEGSALRTGHDSRSELTFADLTITRLGENTIFSVNKAGRSVRLDSGTILLYARKNSGGAEISTKAVSVGITGTTVIFESRDSYDRLTVLEGDARFSLNNFPDQTTEVHAGELLNVNAGATKLPKPGRVDLRRIVRTHPLIKNFPPLPSLDLILATIQNPNAPRPPAGGNRGPIARPTVYAPNPPGPPPGTTPWPNYPVPTPRPSPNRPTPEPTSTPTATAQPIATTAPSAKPTPRRPISPRPTSTPKKKYPTPKKRPTPTPSATQVIR